MSQDGPPILTVNRSGSTLASRIKIVPTSELPPNTPEKVKVVTKEIPKQFALEKSYPNPFDPVTILKYELPIQSHVRVGFFDCDLKEWKKDGTGSDRCQKKNKPNLFRIDLFCSAKANLLDPVYSLIIAELDLA